jgi:galactokinase
VLPAAIDLEIRIAYLRRDDGAVRLSRHDDGTTDGFDLGLNRPRQGTWLDYVAGTAWALAAAGLPPSGLRGLVESTLPANAGLSSSAAIELAAAWALLGDAAEGVDRLALAKICQRAENEYVGVQCGLMDQFASSCGVAGAALLLDCRSLEWRPVAIPADLRLVVCHTGLRRQLDGSAFNERRAECERAVAGLRVLDPSIGSLRDVTAAHLADLGDRLDTTSARRARHVVEENARVPAVVDAFAADDRPALGELFAASHASLRDLFEVSSPALDAMVEIARAVPGVIAARMTGAGFGGCTINLVEPDGVERLRVAVEREYPPQTGHRPLVLPVNAAAGAGFLN